MKTLQDYLTESKKCYTYHVKFLQEIDEEIMDGLEKVFVKYDVESIGMPTRSILQRHPIGFSDVPPSCVYTIVITTSRPALGSVIQADLCQHLGMLEKYVKVHSENDPFEVREKFQEETFDIDVKAVEDELEEVLSGFEAKTIGEIPQAFGNEYNQLLLQYLAYQQAKKAEDPNNKATVFAWLNTLKADRATEFVDEFGGTKTVSGSTIDTSKEVKPPFEMAPDGNFDNRQRHVVKTFKDAKDQYIKLVGDR